MKLNLCERLFNDRLELCHTPVTPHAGDVIVACRILTDVTYLSLATCSEEWWCFWQPFMLHMSLGFVAFLQAPAVCPG